MSSEVPQQVERSPDTRVDNGVMRCVPGEYIGLASKTLPDPAVSPDEVMCVEVDTTAAWVGRVRLSFRKSRYRKSNGKSAVWSWACFHAERLE